jgi:hypothetical protein
MNIATTKPDPCGASARVPAQYPDLCPDRRHPGRGRLHVLANILHGPLWLRWVALAVFIAAGVPIYLDGYLRASGASNPRSAACSIRSPTSSWWRPAC